MLADELHRTRPAPGQRLAIHEHRAGPRALVAGQHPGQGGLPEAGGRLQVHPLAGGHGQGEALVEQGPPPVAEGNVAGL